VFSESYIPDGEAKSRLKLSHPKPEPSASREAPGSDISSLRWQDGTSTEDSDSNESQTGDEYYERMVLNGRPYLCTIPHVEAAKKNATQESTTKADHENELAGAADRGWELLQDMEGKPCLYFSTGWWSYSFCYNSQIKQFHSLPPGANGAPLYPPTEDPETPSYILGNFEPKKVEGKKDTSSGRAESPATEVQTRAETSYLVQKLNGGTPCDLTGKERKVEVQFHCHPQSTDRIGWIKETATCTYLMIIYTPRLCNDIAFLPPREVKANPIHCTEILKPEEVSSWDTGKTAEAARQLIEPHPSHRQVVGDIEVGAMKEVGGEGRRIEKGRVVSTPEERAETVVAQKNGKLEGLSKADLRKRNINPEAVEAFRKELQKRAGTKDWKIQIWDEANGQMELRGIIDAESEEDEVGKSEESDPEDMEEGSEEVYKEDL
jgi:protein OS-9